MGKIKVKIFLISLAALILGQGFFVLGQELEADPYLMKLIRQEKFRVILPQVMRENKVDMWIYVKRGDDPLSFELGSDSGIFIFTDRGEKRIERAVLGGRGDRDLYDLFASEDDLPQFVAERDPKRIAVNYSKERPKLNIISEEDFHKLVHALGEKYAQRVVPADRLIVDFLAGRTMCEIALFGELSIISAKAIEKEFDKIVPGVTKLSDLKGNVFVRDPDGNEHNNDDYVIQRGDLIGLLLDAHMLDFSEHNGGIAYVLREGENREKIIAARCALEWGDERNVGALVEQMDNADVAVLCACAAALRRITGCYFGLERRLDEASQRRAATKWKLWYQAQIRSARP